MSKKIRLWKLGSLEHKIVPTQEAIQTLREILQECEDSQKEVVDIIWGPAIEVQEIGGDEKSNIENYIVQDIKEEDDEIIIRAKRT
jgi:hypothetical protein